MRKLALLLAAVALFAVPAFAQDEEPGTIADIVIASTEAEEPEFTVLLEAVLAADPAVVEALSDPEAELTVFAPTDEAFAAALEALELTAEELLASEDLTNILLYHVIEGTVMAETVVGLEDGTEVPTLLGEDAPITVTFGEEGEVFVNDAQVVTTDIEAANGVIHVIDAVLLPPAGDDMEEDMDEEMMEEDDSMEMMGTIADVVIATASIEDEEEAEFTILLQAVQAADPAVLEALSDPEGELTVFAPTDAAFAAALEALELTAEELLASEDLTNILLYHVIEGTVMAEDVVALEDGTEVPTLLGEDAPITVTFGEEGEVFVNDAQVLITDVAADNGVIHVINAVLLPPSGE